MRLGSAACAAVFLAGPVAADDGIGPDLARYELGRRLKHFEAEWEKGTDPAARKRAAAELEKVHPQFLSLRFAEAARTLDRAVHALRSDRPPTPEEEWAAGLIAVPKARFLDLAEKTTEVTIRPLYRVEEADPRSPRLGLTCYPGVHETWTGPGRLPRTLTVGLVGGLGFRTPEARLRLTVMARGVARESIVGLSQKARAADRVKALQAAAAGWKTFDTLEQATVRDRAALLADLLDGGVPETDLPAGPLLAQAETMAEGKPFFGPGRPGDQWLSVPLGGRKTVPVRVFVPKGLDPAKPVPVVVGLHGAGGSENLFFEGYGAGRAVKLCEERGWVFVATRGGLDFLGAPPVAEVLDGLAKRYPIDPKRAFLVGHSMGAAQAVRLAQQHRGRFAAVAALGGGGRVSDPKPFAGLPVFVAAGEKDFGLGMARALNKTLTAGGAKDLTYREYPGAEHLLIVREALPDVFARFDKVANSP
ncbi:MAG: hypothetical protein K2X87_03300 [Gemmataceae bacterium]|nr:hypothetical protein [Gemmataceae bacterium]